MKKIIETKVAAIGPYSPAVQVDDFLFCSGQIPLNPETNELITGDVKAQTDQVMRNVGALLEAANLGFENIIKTTIFLTSMNDFASVNGVYASYFKSQYPARSTVEVSALPKGANVEIEVIAKRF